MLWLPWETQQVAMCFWESHSRPEAGRVWTSSPLSETTCWVPPTAGRPSARLAAASAHCPSKPLHQSGRRRAFLANQRTLSRTTSVAVQRPERPRPRPHRQPIRANRPRPSSLQSPASGEPIARRLLPLVLAPPTTLPRPPQLQVRPSGRPRRRPSCRGRVLRAELHSAPCRPTSSRT